MSRKTEDTRNKIGRSKVSEGIRRSHKPNQDVVIDDSQIQPMPNVTPQSRRDRSPRTNDTIQVSRTNMTRIKPARNRELNKSSKNKFHGKSKQNPKDHEVYDQIDANAEAIGISNNIGVGILSYNRPRSLKRLIDSIIRYTDLSRTTIFVSDDGSTDSELLKYLNDLAETQKFCIIKNTENIGIAGNSNRLIQCLARFKYCLLLNDDIEILEDGWDHFYFDVMNKMSMEHFIFRQPGIYSADLGVQIQYNNVSLYKSDSKPQGAALAFMGKSIQTVGYFDESYGQYGMEHVDWSMRFFETKRNTLDGFYDVEDSLKYFKLNDEESQVENRHEKLKAAREIFSRRISKITKYTNKAKMDSISVVIPYRDQSRSESVTTVIENMRAQLFPVLNIYLIEHDHSIRINQDSISPAKYYNVKAHQEEPFNKSAAFNMGVDIASDEFLILHDADMMMPNYYATEIYKTLSTHSSCHLGKDVSYYTENDTDRINKQKRVLKTTAFERYITYFEGGSLACTKSYYKKIGGFYEEYVGYGCEDCDFYLRLSVGGSFKEDRRIPLYHLWHPRTDKWIEHHELNVKLQEKLDKYSHSDRLSDARYKLSLKGYKTI
jgi:GT2 family glycosyltransferase